MIEDRMQEFQREVQKYHHNKNYVRKQFEELNIHFDERELTNATNEIVKHCRSIAIHSPEYQTTFHALDKEGLININTFEMCLEHQGNKNIKEFLLSRENQKIQKQPEIKYSLEKNNEVGRCLRSLNDVMIKEYEKNPFVMTVIARQLLKKIFNIVDTNNYDSMASVLDRNYIKYFKNNETYITHKPFFWIAFSFAYKHANLNEFNYKDWLDILIKRDRLDGLFLERTRFIGSEIDERHTRDSFKNIKLDDYFYVYRGFLVRPDKDVRKNRKKLNNPLAHIFDEGKGISFSRQKDHAKFFAGRYHFKSDLDFRKKFPTFYGNKSHSKLKKQLIKDWKNDYYGFFNQHYLDENVRRCVGTFRMKKKDIILYSIMDDEDEVIVDPNNVELVRYDFMNDDTFFDIVEKRTTGRHNYPPGVIKCAEERQKKYNWEAGVIETLQNIPLENLKEFKLN